MKFKIHFIYKSENIVHDYFVVEGDTIEEIREKIKKEESKRNLNPDINECWSEEIKGK